MKLGRLKTLPKTKLPIEEVGQVISQIESVSQQTANTVIIEHQMMLKKSEREENYIQCAQIRDGIKELKQTKQQYGFTDDQSDYESLDHALYATFELLNYCESKEKGRVLQTIYLHDNKEVPVLSDFQQYEMQFPEEQHKYSAYIFAYRGHGFVTHKREITTEIETRTDYLTYKACDCSLGWTKLQLIADITSVISRLLTFYKLTK